MSHISADERERQNFSGRQTDDDGRRLALRQLGGTPSFESFTLSRINLESCYLRVAGRRIDGVPLFDAGFTGPEGVHGAIGLLGSGAAIALAESEPATLTDTDTEQRNQVEEGRRSNHRAIIVLTRGPKPGLFLLNAGAFSTPFGPPTLQISSSETDWLREQAAAHAEATLVAYVSRTDAKAFNVTAKIAGRNPALAPLVIMAPRSGWWQCASEQGSRLVCWLEVIRTVVSGRPVRDCFFVALSGHELGFLGMNPYLTRRPDLIRRAHAWIFFGSDIGAPRQPNLIHASDDVLERWAVEALAKEGIEVDAKAPHDSIARGETRTVQRAGGRFLTVACDSEVYHNIADRWPESIDVSLLARYARAFASGVLDLARQTV